MEAVKLNHLLCAFRGRRIIHRHQCHLSVSAQDGSQCMAVAEDFLPTLQLGCLQDAGERYFEAIYSATTTSFLPETSWLLSL